MRLVGAEATGGRRSVKQKKNLFTAYATRSITLNVLNPNERQYLLNTRKGEERV